MKTSYIKSLDTLAIKSSPTQLQYRWMEEVVMRASDKDVNELVPLIIQLWPDNTLDDAEETLREYISGEHSVAIAHVMDGKCVGLALYGLRHDYVEGCNTCPVGYLEGIVVDQDYRKKGIVGILCKECEEWAKEHGGTEFASDCELFNEESLRFHLRIGFKEENRIICFKKEI